MAKQQGKLFRVYFVPFHLFSLASGYLCMEYLHNLGALSLLLSLLILFLFYFIFFPIESMCKPWIT
jgi:hypothetical protein